VERSPARFVAAATSCEVCGRALRPRRLRGGGVLHRCPECGHLQRSLAECPARHRSEAYGGDPTLDVVRLGLTFRLITRSTRPRRVFEIGFGSGAMLRRFLAAGASVSGTDSEQLGVRIDPEVARRGRLWWKRMEDLDTEDHVVDLVYGIHVIEHVDDVAGALRVAHRMLSPGGRVVLLTPAGDSWGLRLFGAGWWLLEDPTHVRFFSARSARRACESAGFRDVRVRRLWTDNVTMEVASLARLLDVAADAPGGVLSSRAVMVTGVLSAPVVLLVRALLPRLRPTLYVEARR
jgi:SAM-dependent methyltransferase